LNGGNWYTDLDDALTAINGLSADGGTDYDAALEEVVAEVNGTDFPTGAVATKAIFVTDGQPTQNNGTGTDGIDETDTNNTGFGGLGEESYWIQYLESNGFDQAYAIGFGGIGSDELSELEPIAVDVADNEVASTYEGGTDANDDNVIIVEDGDSLTLGLLQTLDSVPAVGNVLDNDTGVDAPLSLVSVTYGVQTHTFATDGGTATFALENTDGEYGDVEILEDGSFTYTVTGTVDVLETASIDYTVTDADGDEDTATLSLQAAPRVLVQSIVAASGALAEAGATSESFTVTLEEGPQATQSFGLASSALVSGDVTAAVSGTGVSYDAVTGIVMVEAGVTSFDVTLTAVDDEFVEGTEESTLNVGVGSVDFDIADNDSYTLVEATSADDTLVGLAAAQQFTWELADVQNTNVSVVESTLPDLIGQLDSTDEGANDSVRERSADFTVSAGESVSFTFTASVENLDEDTSGTVSSFRWRVEESNGDTITSWETYDNDSTGVVNGDVVLNLSDSSTTNPDLSGLDGTYRLEFQTREGAHADITEITLTTNSPSNTDTVEDFDVALDALDIGDLLVGGGELSLNFDSGEAQVVVSNAGAGSVDQIVNLDGVTETALETALGLDPSADATSILNAMVDQGRILIDS